MYTFENGVPNEAILVLLEWTVTNASWDFKAMKKRWSCALLNVNATVLWKHLC